MKLEVYLITLQLCKINQCPYSLNIIKYSFYYIDMQCEYITNEYVCGI